MNPHEPTMTDESSGEVFPNTRYQDWNEGSASRDKEVGDLKEVLQGLLDYAKEWYSTNGKLEVTLSMVEEEAALVRIALRAASALGDPQ